MQPGNPVVGGTILRRAAIQSPNFASALAGWFIGADGSAEFNNLIARGEISVGGGTGQARIVFTSDLPSPLDTYTLAGNVGFVAALIFYPGGGSDTTYEFLAIADGTTGALVQTVWGIVNQGSVSEWSTGVPNGIRNFLVTSGGSMDQHFNASRYLNLQAGSEIQVQGRKAYLTTLTGTVDASADLTLGTAYTQLSGTGLNITTVTDNAILLVDGSFVFDLQASVSSNTTCYGRVTLGGNIEGRYCGTEFASGSAAGRFTPSQQWRLALGTAGTYTVALTARKTTTSGTIKALMDHSGYTYQLLESGG